LWGRQNIVVGSADVSGISVTLRHGLRVRGHVEFSGTTAAPAPAAMQQMDVRLVAVGAPPAVGQNVARVGTDGQFVIGSFQPGRYTVFVYGVPAGWSLVSAMHQGKDVSDVPLEIGSDEISDIVLKFSDRVTTLSGTVRDVAGNPDAEADVIVFPADQTVWRQVGVSSRRSRATRTSKTGTYTISNLPPGEYFAVAVSAVSSGDWQNPRILDALARVAARVTLADGDARSADLRTSVIK
jgi:hypothetical protein